MWPANLHPATPGLFVTGTDTNVGKTVVTCAIAHHLCRTGGEARRVGVCKPFATGCRAEREGLVSEDAEALAHFANCQLPLEVINPLRYRAPLAPAVAAAQCGQPPDPADLAATLRALETTSDVIVVEGVGGLLVPIDDQRPRYTLLDLIRGLDYPVVVVTRPSLGTLNHTAMTVRLLVEAGCRVGGLVINRVQADAAACPDPSAATNAEWMQRMTDLPVLARVPQCEPDTVAPAHGRLASAVLDATGHIDWMALAAPPRPDALLTR